MSVTLNAEINNNILVQNYEELSLKNSIPYFLTRTFIICKTIRCYLFAKLLDN